MRLNTLGRRTQGCCKCKETSWLNNRWIYFLNNDPIGLIPTGPCVTGSLRATAIVNIESSLARTQASLSHDKNYAQRKVGRRTLPLVPCGSSPVTRVSRSPRCENHAKNGAPEEKKGIQPLLVNVEVVSHKIYSLI